MFTMGGWRVEGGRFGKVEGEGRGGRANEELGRRELNMDGQDGQDLEGGEARGALRKKDEWEEGGAPIRN